MDDRSGTTWGEVVHRRARASLIGRRAELELVRATLDAETPDHAVIWFAGPGGIGKSTLLDAVAADAAARPEVRTARLDSREAGRSADDLRRAFAAIHREPADVDDERRLLLVVDDYEHLAPLDALVRTELLPALPSDALVVLASRTPPNGAWRVDPGWHDLVRVVSLRNLDPAEARHLLQARGVDRSLHDRLVGLTHGHPLALALVADVVGGGDEVDEGPLPPALVEELVSRLVGVVPPERRRALEVCALARVTTESLLRDVLGSEAAAESFRWLAGLSIVRPTAEGLAPHDMARDVLDADLRWRDPVAYKEVFRAVRRHVHQGLRTTAGAERVAAAFDLKYLFRRMRTVLSPIDWQAWGHHHPAPALPGERDEVVELVAAAEGPESAAIAARWFDRQPEAVHVLRRDDGGVQGTLFLLDLTAATEADRRADPVAATAWRFVHREAPPRSGERVTLTRFVIDRDAYQGPSPTLNATPVVTLLRYVEQTNLAWDLLTLHEPDPWDDYFALADLHRARGCDVEVGGRRYGLFAHDFRRVPVDDMVELWTERALAEDPAPPVAAGASPELVVLSHADFGTAVRDALRDLHRPDRLATNPLLATRVARDRAGDGAPSTATLVELLGEAVAALGSEPRDDTRRAALERTYLRAAPSQEAAAEVLGLPFSTYRRHLTQGRDRVIAWLWERELHGRGAG